MRLSVCVLGAALCVWLASCGGNGNGGGSGARSWGTPVRIETGVAGDAYSPEVAMDDGGNAISVWQENDGTRYNIWANRYDVASGWGTAELIETDDAGSASIPKIAMTHGGNATAVWHQYDGTTNNIWANRYEPGSGWGTAELIEAIGDGAGNPWVAMDAAGNAIAVWQAHDGALWNVWANRCVPGAGWGTAVLVESYSAGGACYPHVAMDAAGNATAVWWQDDASRENICANRYDESTGTWGTAELIEEGTGNARGPRVAMDASGVATAVWRQNDSWRSIWANRHVPGAGWGSAELLETGNSGDAIGPRVAMDGSGGATVVWYQSNGVRDNIWANRCDGATGNWGTAELVETNDSGHAYDPDVAVDAGRNAVAVWRQHDGTRYNIWASRFDASSGWGAPELIETDDAGGAEWPRVAMDPSGNATAVWRQSDGALWHIWANRFEVGGGPGTPLGGGCSGGATAHGPVSAPVAWALVFWLALRVRASRRARPRGRGLESES